MNSDFQPNASHDDVLRKIGRNHLLFQQAEGLMKQLVALGSLPTHTGETPADFKTRASFCQNMTMGQVANLFLDRLGPNPPRAADETAERAPSCHFSISIHINPPGDPEERKQLFARLVDNGTFSPITSSAALIPTCLRALPPSPTNWTNNAA
jgi:hypothetical protein